VLISKTRLTKTEKKTEECKASVHAVQEEISNMLEGMNETFYKNHLDVVQKFELLYAMTGVWPSINPSKKEVRGIIATENKDLKFSIETLPSGDGLSAQEIIWNKLHLLYQQQ